MLRTARTGLEPLTVAHAEEMAPLLADPALYEFTSGRPVGIAELRRRYGAMALWLREQGADTLAANIDPAHAASMRVAHALGLSPTDAVIGGETRCVGSFGSP